MNTKWLPGPLRQWLLRRELQELALPLYDPTHSQGVAQFYDRYHEAFLEVYGELIQAFRTLRHEDLLQAQGLAMQLQNGQRLLDAGCGVGLPACYFAEHFGVEVDAITISSKQAERAIERARDAGLEQKVRVLLGDYHDLQQHFEKESFDRVCFLESFGHSTHKAHLFKAVREVLKPGGLLYIKDLFVRKVPYVRLQARVDEEIKRINSAYCYEVAELSALVDMAREAGFVIQSIRTVDIALEDFENLAISNQWQELTGIAQIKDWDQYVFPVDFFEIVLYKHDYNPQKGKHRFFLQNQFEMRVNQLKADELGY